MCGLFGTTHTGVPAAAIIERARRALHTLEHRGPDQWGDVDDSDVYMGHRRLSILDTSEVGAQPMVSDDGRYAITVNGEIYNYRDLTAQLSSHRFRSGSDSEVVLHGMREWGIRELVQRLDGMYAVVVHDRVERRVHLFRDRVGIKPLYYRLTPASLVWASELKAIRDYVGESRLALDHTAIYDFLTYRYVPSPKSLYRDVFKLRPAELVSVDVATLAAQRTVYWAPELATSDATDAEIVDELRTLIDDAVDRHLMADVPVGFFLSGGLDSAIVLSHAAHHHPDPVAYTIGYDDPARDESAAASVVAGAFGARHVVRRLAAPDSVDLPATLAAWYDEPFADSSALSTYHVAALARTESTVALSGDGGDELFAGYRWYDRVRRLAPAQRALRPLSRRTGATATAERLPGELGRRVGRNIDRIMRHDDLALYAHLMGDHLGTRKERWSDRLGIPDDYDPYWLFREHDRPDLPHPLRHQWLDFKTFLPDDVLTKVDRVSMAVSLEVRVPLLDRSVVEFALALPTRFQFGAGELKHGLRAAYRDALPQGVADRPKQGFSLPIASWRGSALDGHDTLTEAVLAQFVSAD